MASVSAWASRAVRLAAWGWNNIGQLGDNSITTRFLPVAVNVSLGMSALHAKTVVAVAPVTPDNAGRGYQW